MQGSIWTDASLQQCKLVISCQVLVFLLKDVPLQQGILILGQHDVSEIMCHSASFVQRQQEQAPVYYSLHQVQCFACVDNIRMEGICRTHQSTTSFCGDTLRVSMVPSPTNVMGRERSEMISVVQLCDV